MLDIVGDMRFILTETDDSSTLAASPDCLSPNYYFASASVKVAIIATAAVRKGLGHVYALSGGGSPWVTEVFETEKEAHAWRAG